MIIKLANKSIAQLMCSEISSTSTKALSPLDGRYSKQTQQLTKYFSQSALMKYRIKVQAQWMLHLLHNNIIPISPTSNLQKFQQQIRNIYINFNDRSSLRIKQIQSTTNHDLKSIQYFIKQNISEYKQNVHLCCTSQDINNLAYSLLLTQSLSHIIIPTLQKIKSDISSKSIEWSQHAMLARTHGQPATPTTLGKQLANFAYRLKKQINYISTVKLYGKMNGATGNYNAHYFAYPNINWLQINKNFVQNILKLQFNPYTTQIQSHDSISRLYGQLSLCNTILIGLCRDIWQYISINYIKQNIILAQIGSSTMPHKVNPIDFQNCQGNLGVANSVMEHFRCKLPISRLQRDLSDSTVLRCQGTALGHSIVGYNSLLKGLGKINSNKQHMLNELSNHYQVTTQAIQTQLRKIGYPQPYQLLKKLSRSQAYTQQTKYKLINQLKLTINQQSIDKITNLKPENYLGKSVQLAKKILQF